jgi:2,4-dienoyl-CoA reductase [(3E)-enoyl-CoA-producing], peroxisomal
MTVFREDVLAGKTALITGGGSGICKGIAMRFAGHGANVAITSRKQERLDEAAADIREATGRDVLAVAADVRNPEQVEAVVKATVEKFGGVDILINGAAGNFPIPAAQLSYNGFRTVVEIDLEGTFNMSKACFEHLAKAGETHGNANIINITATLQYTGMPFQAHVSSAKAGIDALTRTLANEWGPIGIRVNGVAPGPIADTEGMRRLAPTPEDEAKVNKRVPLQRMGTIQEIADACIFLVSDASQYTTGAILVVDGGSWLASTRVGGLGDD